MTTAVETANTPPTLSRPPVPGLVVVGTDGSDPGSRAVMRAAAEAARRGAALRIVHAVRAPTSAPPSRGSERPGRPARNAAARIVEAASEAALHRHPELPVEAEVGVGLPGDVLLEAAQRAELIVVSARGRGGFADLLLGSVARFLAARTPCPMLVVRGESGAPSEDGDLVLDGDRVVVGVQGEHDAPTARAAFGEARRWGLPVYAVHAFDWPGYPSLDGPGLDDLAVVTAAHSVCLDSALGQVREAAPDVVSAQAAVPADAAATVIDATNGAALAVVGVRHRNGLLRHWVGHVTHAAIEHAHCPVLVVPLP
ncbi:universal stress protein [Yinghuangia seranimata]|uniref:universal stress protein n=1 Tax=Yinghuangia seranimata TaxID=408067 RepID=UPI00248D130A|nr:universal stress protein [Yinghuangia seranimata]MDI2125329.1 universal stress protein [Yinghuangia seranimata]